MARQYGWLTVESLGDRNEMLLYHCFNESPMTGQATSKEVDRPATSSAIVVLRTASSKTFTTWVPGAADNPDATETCSVHEAQGLGLVGSVYFLPVEAGRFGSFASGNFTVFPVQAAW